MLLCAERCAKCNTNNMCDQHDSPAPDNKLYQRFRAKLKEDDYKNVCFKCKTSTGYVLLQSKDVYCRDCFHEMVRHKFRGPMARSKLIQSADQMLIAFSGGLNSMALFRLVVEGRLECVDEHRRLRFVPSIHYIEESILNPDGPVLRLSYAVFEYLYNTGFTFYISALESSIADTNLYFTAHKCSDTVGMYNQVAEYIKHCRTNHGEDFLTAYNRLQTPSSRQDFLAHIRVLQSARVASSLQIPWLSVGSTATELAINFMTFIALGRGRQLPCAMNLCDDRFGAEVRILRPLMQFTNKEIVFYLYDRLPPNLLQGLEFTRTKPSSSGKTNEMCQMTRNFLLNLQQSFPATLHTIYKTGSKISTVGNDNLGRCRFCWSSLDTNQQVDGDNVCSAFEALQLTSKLSNKLDTIAVDSSQFCYACLKIRCEMIRFQDGLFLEKFCRGPRL